MSTKSPSPDAAPAASKVDPIDVQLAQYETIVQYGNNSALVAELFQRLDTDKDRFLSHEELAKVIQATSDLVYSPARMEGWFDTDVKDGRFSLKEFGQYLADIALDYCDETQEAAAFLPGVVQSMHSGIDEVHAIPPKMRRTMALYDNLSRSGEVFANMDRNKSGTLGREFVRQVLAEDPLYNTETFNKYTAVYTEDGLKSDQKDAKLSLFEFSNLLAYMSLVASNYNESQAGVQTKAMLDRLYAPMQKVKLMSEREKYDAIMAVGDNGKKTDELFHELDFNNDNKLQMSEIADVISFYDNKPFNATKFRQWYDRHGSPDGVIDIHEFRWYVADVAYDYDKDIPTAAKFVPQVLEELTKSARKAFVHRQKAPDITYYLGDGMQISGLNEVLNPSFLLQDGMTYPHMRVRRVRRELVPVSQRVKVAAPKLVIVPTTIQHKVAVRVHDEQPAEQPVEEEYSDYDYEEYEEEVTYFEEQQVEVPYTAKVPVVEEKVVERQSVKFEKETAYMMVRVPVNKKVQVQGVRYDEIEEQKVVEVEEWEEFEMVPHKTGLKEAASFRDVGVSSGSRVVRTGHRVFATQTLDLPSMHIERDNVIDPVDVQTVKDIEAIPVAEEKVAISEGVRIIERSPIPAPGSFENYTRTSHGFHSYTGHHSHMVETSDLQSLRQSALLSGSEQVDTRLSHDKTDEYLRDLFQRVDANGDGYVSRLELIKGLERDSETQKAFGLTDDYGLNTITRFGDAMSKMDRNNDGRVSFSEFRSYFMNN